MVMDSQTSRNLAAAIGGAFGRPAPGMMSPLGQQQAGPYHGSVVERQLAQALSARPSPPFEIFGPGVRLLEPHGRLKQQDERIGELEREVEKLRPETALEHVLAAPLRAVKDLRSCIRKEAERLEDEVERRARR